MYSASAQSTSRFLVMSARPHKIRERPTGGKGQPQVARTGPSCPKQPEPKGPGPGVCTQCTRLPLSRPWQGPPPAQPSSQYSGRASFPWKEQIPVGGRWHCAHLHAWSGVRPTPRVDCPNLRMETGAVEGSHFPTVTAIRCLNLRSSAQAMLGSWGLYSCTDPVTCTQSGASQHRGLQHTVEETLGAPTGWSEGAQAPTTSRGLSRDPK